MYISEMTLKGIVAEMSTDIVTVQTRPERSVHLPVNANKYYILLSDGWTFHLCKNKGQWRMYGYNTEQSLVCHSLHYRGSMCVEDTILTPHHMDPTKLERYMMSSFISVLKILLKVLMHNSV